MRILTLYQANAPTLTSFSKEDQILIKNLYECNGYNAWQFISFRINVGRRTASAAGEVEKVRNTVDMLTRSM